MNPVDQWYPVASIGALHYRKNGTRFDWFLTISRWLTASTWTIDDPQYGYGWGFDDGSLANHCNNGGAGWGASSGYGWGGYGWAYGAAYGWGWWTWGTVVSASYMLEAPFRCGGDTNVFNLIQDGVNPDEWPAYVTIRRVPGGAA